MSVEQKLFDALALENAALKAQVVLIQKRNTDLLDSNRGFEYSSGLDRLFDAINKTPHQCLNDIKADAVEDAAKWLSPETSAGEEGCDLLRQYAQQLRDSVK